MTQPDHYQLLGVERDATHAEMRKAYLSLAKSHHPDAGGDHGFMTSLNLAWATLRLAKSRQAYDLTLPALRTRSPRAQRRVVEKVVRRATVAGAGMQPAPPPMDDDSPNWYEVLGVWSQANRRQVLEALDDRLRELTNEDDPGEVIGRREKLAMAARILLDPARRRALDAMLNRRAAASGR